MLSLASSDPIGADQREQINGEGKPHVRRPTSEMDFLNHPRGHRIEPSRRTDPNAKWETFYLYFPHRSFSFPKQRVASSLQLKIKMSTSAAVKRILTSNLRNHNPLLKKNFSGVASASHLPISSLRRGNLNCNGSATNFRNQSWLKVRNLSDKASEKAETKEEEAAEDDTKTEEEKSAEGETEMSETDKLKEELKNTKDQLLRSLAEQENIRGIAKRDVENSRSFAVTSFAKSLLDTSDNLTRAMDAVPEEYRTDTENNPVLATLYEGISMTDNGLNKAFAKNGLKKFAEPGDKFDPNLHDALFEYPDEKLEAGTIGQVMKVGFMLNERVIRPAEVGVIKKA